MNASVPEHIASELRPMMDAMAASGQGFFEVHTVSFDVFEKGYYGILLVKPTKRLSHMLGDIDREVLILFSNFEEQQPRSVTFGKRLIQKMSPRLETSTFIIVHKSGKTGNRSLQKWGREENVSILPLYFEDSFPRGNDFERLLCRQLYHHDPFDLTGPVSGDADFFGRRTEALEVANRLRTGAIRSLLGLRRIGKTSYIHRVLSIAQREHNCFTVFIDCSRDAVFKLNAPSLMLSIAHAVSEGTKLASSSSNLELLRKTGSIADASRRLSDAVRQSPKSVVLAFDEIDFITPNSPEEPELWRKDFVPFWRNLRVVFHQCLREHSSSLSLLIAGVSSKWFCMESIDGIENSAAAFIPEEYVAPLPRGASTAMISSLARRAGLIFTPEVRESIAEFCGDVPFWIRKACSYLHRKIPAEQRPVEIDSIIGKELLQRFADEEGASVAKFAFSHLLRVYPELRGPAALALSGKMSEIGPVAKARLQRYAVLSEGSSPAITSGLVRIGLFQALHDNLDIEPSKMDGNVHVDRAAQDRTLDDWAEDLAQISKRRNLLEAKLRELLLNFIRADVMQNKRGTVPERLLATRPEKDRAGLQRLPTDQIVKQLYWKELTQLIGGKEWGLFERLFGDKKRFQDASEILNDRPDAHAKDIELAQIGLQQRELRFIEDKLLQI